MVTLARYFESPGDFLTNTYVPLYSVAGPFHMTSNSRCSVLPKAKEGISIHSFYLGLLARLQQCNLEQDSILADGMQIYRAKAKEFVSSVNLSHIQCEEMIEETLSKKMPIAAIANSPEWRTAVE